MKMSNIRNHMKNVFPRTLVVIIGILFWFCLQNISVIISSINVLLQVLSPIIYGIVIAYLLAPMCNFFDKVYRKWLLKQIKDSQKAINVSNGLSTATSFLIFILFLIFIFSLIIPQLAVTITGMIETLPDNINNLSALLKDNAESNPVLKKSGIFWSQIINYIRDFFKENLVPHLNKIISGLSIGVAQIFKMIFDIFIGIFVSIYCLSGRKTFSRQFKKIIYLSLKKNHANVFMKYVRLADKAFSEFINGKLLEAFIVGMIVFLGMSIIGTQYALLIGVIIGITNIIPFLGPFIGGLPAALILLFEDPMKCLHFVIFLIILMQIDGNILGPKILGNSTGLSGFWIMFSLILFGGLFGIIGMMIGIPLFSVIYRIISDSLNYMLKKKNQSNDNLV